MVTEGTSTEPQYVEGLNISLRSKASTPTVKSVGVGRDPLHVVRRCVELRNKVRNTEKEYSVCVCLVDVDQHQKLSDAAELAEREGILLLISNLKFEVWLLWHKEDKRAAQTSHQLDKRARELDLVLDKSISLGFPFTAVDSACRTARAADPDMKAGRKGPDPSSAMPILVDLLQGTATPGGGC